MAEALAGQPLPEQQLPETEELPPLDEQGFTPEWWEGLPPQPTYTPPPPDFDEVTPWTIENATTDEAFEYIRASEGVEDDPYASQLLWDGWFNPNVTPQQRQMARDDYYHYMSYDPKGQGFSWDDWRSWYEAMAG